MLSWLKRWSDYYPFPCEGKNTELLIRPRRIVVTSNYSMGTLYGADDASYQALRSRFRIWRFEKVPTVGGGFTTNIIKEKDECE